MGKVVEECGDAPDARASSFQAPSHTGSERMLHGSSHDMRMFCFDLQPDGEEKWGLVYSARFTRPLFSTRVSEDGSVTDGTLIIISVFRNTCRAQQHGREVTVKVVRYLRKWRVRLCRLPRPFQSRHPPPYLFSKLAKNEVFIRRCGDDCVHK